MECRLRGAGPDFVAGTGKQEPPGGTLIMHQASNPDGAYRLDVAAATRPGDPGDRDRGRDMEPAGNAFYHRPRHRLADRSVLLQQLGRDAELIPLDGIVIGDNASDEHIGAACNLGEPCAYQPAGAGLRHCDPEFP